MTGKNSIGSGNPGFFWHEMSHIMRKPVFAICEQQRRKSAGAYVQSDKRLYCHCLDSTIIPKLAKSKFSRL